MDVENMDINNLPIGQKVCFKGDAANLEGYGRITRKHDHGQLGFSYDVVLTDGRTFNRVDPNAFISHYRWELLDEESGFDYWFSKFLEEKELTESVLEFEDRHQWHIFPVKVIQEYMSKCSWVNQYKFSTKLRQLDFHNADIKHFLIYTAQWIAKEI